MNFERRQMLLTKPEFRIRLRYTDGKVRVGGYLGATRSHFYMVDGITGEVFEILKTDVENFDAVKI